MYFFLKGRRERKDGQRKRKKLTRSFGAYEHAML
jgi:hypothetical protein